MSNPINATNKIGSFDVNPKILGCLSTSQLEHEYTLTGQYKERGDRENECADQDKECGEIEMERVARELERANEEIELAKQEIKRVKREIERANRHQKSYISQINVLLRIEDDTSIDMLDDYLDSTLKNLYDTLNSRLIEMPPYLKHYRRLSYCLNRARLVQEKIRISRDKWYLNEQKKLAEIADQEKRRIKSIN